MSSVDLLSAIKEQDNAAIGLVVFLVAFTIYVFWKTWQKVQQASPEELRNADKAVVSNCEVYTHCGSMGLLKTTAVVVLVSAISLPVLSRVHAWKAARD